MRIRRAVAATAAAMMLAGGGVLAGSGAAHAAPAAGCHTEIRYVPVTVLKTVQVFENGHWVTKVIRETVITRVTTVVCD
ncbi:hypothetical protein [Streptomyces sp. NPDC020597]|uniref:hypothetical protein n=1 Tax=unclassified Streptomyces TaxID=2593676 RepID=UPI003788103A